MTKDEFCAIEAILFSFPELCVARRARKDFLLSMALSSSSPDAIHVQGGNGVSRAERYAEGDRELEQLETIISKISHSLANLKEADKELVDQFYFSEKGSYSFKFSAPALFMKRKRICAQLEGLMSIYPLFREWRERETERAKEVARDFIDSVERCDYAAES